MSEVILYNSVLDGDLEGVMRCLENGGRVGLVGPQGLTLTPLVTAAKNGHTDICGLLLAHGGNVNEVESNSKLTALHYAAATGNESLVEALLSSPGEQRWIHRILKAERHCMVLAKRVTWLVL